MILDSNGRLLSAKGSEYEAGRGIKDFSLVQFSYSVRLLRPHEL